MTPPRVVSSDARATEFLGCVPEGGVVVLRTGPRREQTRGEELANGISHGLALVATSVGTPFLILRAARQGDPGFLVGTGAFAATALFLYLGSTIYHLLPAGKTKRAFRVVEHSAIFLLIAGTYTPFTLGVLRGGWGSLLLGMIWVLALAGVVLKVLVRTPHPVLWTGLYLAMGWLVVIAIEPVFALVPAAGLRWLIAGGLAYTVGVAFFATAHWLRYGHLIWHLFVMAGTTCHYFAVLWYAA